MKFLPPLIVIMIFTVSIAVNAETPKTNANYEIINQEGQLPELVLTMKEEIIEAAASGNMEELRGLFESNELAPILTDKYIDNPITYWKNNSIDGTGRQFLAALAEVLTLPPVKTKDGHFIWPYLAKVPLDKLTPKQQIDLFRLVGPKQAVTMLKANKYSYFELMIGNDGTWHEFKKPKEPKQ